MGFQLNKKKGPVSEINVTPMVDVMLVLLVIFMVTAPLMYNGINLKLPKTSKVQSVKLTNDQIVLSITKSGEYYFGKQKFLIQELIREVQAKLSMTKNKTVYIRADYGIQYGKVAKLMAYLKNGGVEGLALVTESEK